MFISDSRDAACSVRLGLFYYISDAARYVPTCGCAFLSVVTTPSPCGRARSSEEAPNVLLCLGRGALSSATRGLAGKGSSPSLLHVILVLVCEHVYGFLQSVLGAVGSLGIDNKVVGPVAHVVATHTSVPTFGYIVPLV